MAITEISLPTRYSYNVSLMYLWFYVRVWPWHALGLCCLPGQTFVITLTNRMWHWWFCTTSKVIKSNMASIRFSLSLPLSLSLSLLLSLDPSHHFLRKIAHMERPSRCIPTDNDKEAPCWQPASLPDMWLKEPSDDSSPQNIFQLRPQIWWKWKMKMKVTLSYPTLCDTMEFSRPEYWSG